MNASTPPPIGTIGPIGLPDYAELHCISNFTFLTGASHPHELVARAKALGYRALALTDECSVAGTVRAHVAAKEAGLKLIVGSRFTVRDAQGEPWLRLVLLAQDIDGYGNLCECITQARLAAPKGDYRLLADDLAAPAAGLAHLRGMPHCLAILLPDYDPDPQRLRAQALWCRQVFGDRLSMALELPLRHADDRHRGTVAAVSEQADVPLVATGDVAMHSRQRKPLHDVLTAIRLSRPIAECGLELAPSAEQAMRTRMQLAFFYQGERGAPLLRRSVELAALCDFSLDEIEYEYPHEVVPEGQTPAAYLHAEVMAGAARRYGKAIPAKVQAQIAEELALIAELRYEPFFLTVYDVVRFARSRGILCQGRGSAANSAVCYCLGITEVDPQSGNTLFARFLSRARNEPPDIDVDFEHQRREEVIQYIYGKYGLTRTALAAALITYRTRSALRDVGRALGIDLGVIEQVAKAQAWWDGQHAFAQHAGQQGLDPESPLVQRWAGLVGQLRGFPRHLSQHVGGFVIAQGKLSRLVPIENAAMQDRRVIQWDKDDLESLRLLKVDVLALGMLTAIRRTLDMLDALPGRRARYGASDKLAMQHLPDEDRDTYDMISRAETIGVFQIESRAQQSMLPRLRPRTYYDLVIQVAIVRPGPIQGGMVHPYLQRREAMRNGNPDCVTYPGPEVRAVLERTLGVPIFQEQVMEIAMKAGGFTADEADRLRRDMAAWKRKGNLTGHQERLMKEMVEVRHYDPAFVEAADGRVCRIRFSRKPCGRLRQVGLRQQLPEMPRAGGVLCRAAQQPADGVLLAVATGAGGAAQLGARAAGGCDGQCMGQHAARTSTRGGRPARHPARPQPYSRHAAAGRRAHRGRAPADTVCQRGRPGTPCRARSPRPERAGRRQCLAAAGGAPPPSAVADAGAAGARPGPCPAAPGPAAGGAAGLARALARRGGRRRLRQPRAVLAEPPAEPAAAPAGADALCHRRHTGRLPQRATGARVRHRHRAAAAGHGQGHHLCLDRGRDRRRQRRALAAPDRTPAPGGAACSPVGRLWTVAVRARDTAPGRAAPGGPDATSGAPGVLQPGFPLTAARPVAMPCPGTSFA